MFHCCDTKFINFYFTSKKLNSSQLKTSARYFHPQMTSYNLEKCKTLVNLFVSTRSLKAKEDGHNQNV